MKPDWNLLVIQKKQEMPEARRKMEKEYEKHQRKMDKLVNKLEKQLFKDVKRQRAGTQELYDMSDAHFSNPAFYTLCPFYARSWICGGWTVKDIENILSEVEQRLIVGGVKVQRHNPTSALFLIAVP